MLALEVELLTGRYVATAYNDRRCPEWPPHPARVFSALVATHFATENPDPAEREVLQWLEQLDPPEIAASPAAVREVVTVFVPVNDTTVVGSFAADEEAIQAAQEAVARTVADSRERATVTKHLAKLEKRLEQKVSKAVSASPKVSKDDLRRGPALLPEGRMRQPRTFPSVTPWEPHFRLVWRDAEPTAEQRKTLDCIASRVVRVGHSSSLVAMRVLDGDVESNWRPAEDGDQTLRVMRAGLLTQLCEEYERHRETEPRVMPAAFRTYSAARKDVMPAVPRSVFDDDWLVLRRVAGPRLPIVAAAAVAAAIRSVLLKFAPDPCPEMISGHRTPGEKSETPHLAIVPLPFVAHRHADGNLLGVALSAPRAASRADRKALFRAVAAWEAANRRLDEDEPELPLHLGSAGVWRIARVEGEATLAALAPSTWCRPARSWASVTPVALDRNPGDLRSTDASKQAAAYAEAEEVLRLACTRIGLPEPARVCVLPFAPIAGSRKARAYPRFPANPSRAQRVLVHAAIDFPSRVRGPVLMGAGRYLGLGLFRPVDDV